MAEGAELAERVEREVAGLSRVVDGDTDADGVCRIGPWLEPARGSDAYQVVRFRVG